MIDMISKDDEVVDSSLASELQECEHKKWNDQSSRCPKAAEGFEPYHKWIIVSTSGSVNASIVTGLMCGICFHEVIVSDAHRHRDCFKT